MTISFKFFHDAALTQEITTANPLTATQDTANVLGPVDKTIYFGSPLAGNKAQVNANPGVDVITVSILDADGAAGAPASEFKLALSAAALDTATAGAALALSATINSGSANAVPIFTRRDSALTTPGLYTDISLQTQEIYESPV